MLLAVVPSPVTPSADFAILVRFLRERRRLTQQELAREADMENGHHRPVKAQRKRILRFEARGGLDGRLGNRAQLWVRT
jgi:hypothetical protein